MVGWRTVKRLVGEKDVWIATYPRSGTTWTQEIIWNIRNGVDVEESKRVDIDVKFDFLDNDFFEDSPIGVIDGSILKLQQGEERNIKCHLPISMLPKDLLLKGKVVYVGRNPSTLYTLHC
ncbi:sulfotransferase 1C4 [Eurytemora carolleeae]|uniref:sulfotransferase 1C4 n=1 Tax=Eurytemora carolleeae TaxID=1294199 RepID=UPI000C758518|nr:sulfotransferase 1C4 [Eurytemora carolleeae]|eukprot:XP_023330114.1 sulfotransferase 1C4-like [Eurytemora affinis]